MTKKGNYYAAGGILCLIAAVFLGVIFFAHIEFKFPWPDWVSYVLLALYLIYTVMIFLMPRYKEASFAVCVILAMQVAAFGLIMISIGSHFETGETNWYLPAGLFLTCAGNFANLYRMRKQKKR